MKSPSAVRAFRADALTVEVYASLDDMALAAALAARESLAEAIRRRGSASVIFAAALSQVRFLDHLVAKPGIDWSRVTGFHMDEYLGITAAHPASFRRFLHERVAGRVTLQGFHDVEGEAAEPIQECERYTRLLAGQPIDLCCLGIGENGHVAFNDPPVADFADPLTVKLVRLDEACRMQQVGEGHYPTLAAVPQYAYTLTVPALCRAGRMICVVPEKRKAEAVRNALRGPVETACPASFLRRQAHCTLFLDEDSASLL